MRPLFWILGALAALAALVCLTRVGVRAGFGETVTLDLRIGPFRLRLLPPPAKPEKPKKPKAEKPPKEEGGKEKKSLPKPTAAELKDAARTLWPPLKRALRRFGRGIRIDPLRLSLTLGGLSEPAEAAERYGELNAAVWTGMPVLEELVDVRAPGIHVGVDFQREETALCGAAGVSIRIGTALAMGIGVGIPALRWFLRFRRARKQSPPFMEGGGARSPNQKVSKG